jgi:hypothetical protein
VTAWSWFSASSRRCRRCSSDSSSADLTEPGPVPGLGQPFLGVAGHVLDAGKLSRIDLQEPAPSAGVLVDTGCAVGTVAVAEWNLAEQEVVLELGPFLPARCAQFTERPSCAPTFDEVLVRRDDLLGEDRGSASRAGGGRRSLRYPCSDSSSHHV